MFRSTVEEITKAQLVLACAQILKKEENDATRLYLIDEGIPRVEIIMHIREVEDHICILHMDYILALERAGYKDIPETKPHISIHHNTLRLKLPSLKARIQSITLCRKSKNLTERISTQSCERWRFKPIIYS